MKANDLNQAMEYIYDEYLDIAEAPGKEKTAMDKRKIWSRKHARPLLAAAIAVLMLLLMGCAVVSLLHMEDWNIGKRQSTAPIFDEHHRQITGERPISQNVLTLSDMKGTPGFLAAGEWLSFLQGYDKDRVIFEKERQKYTDPVSRFPEEYQVYRLYTQEMVEKLDSIRQEYGLKLLGTELKFQSVKEQLRAFGLDHVTMPNISDTVLLESGRSFSGGNFRLGIALTMPKGDGMWPYTVELDFQYHRKDIFSTDFQYLDADLIWREWNYTTASGETVLILRADGESWAYLICDCGDAVISVIFTPGFAPLTDDPDFEALWMTDRQVELVADAIDFSIRPSLPDIHAPAPDGHEEGWEIVPKSALFDGSLGRIVFSMTIPEGIAKNAEWIIPDNAWTMLTPKEGDYAIHPATCYSEDNGNAMELVYVFRAPQIDDPEFPTSWLVRMEDLRMNFFDGINTIEKTAAEGIWKFEIDFAVTSPVELLTEPIAMEEFTITAMELRSLGLTMICQGGNGAVSLGSIAVRMHDGSEVPLWSDCTERIADGIMLVRYFSDCVIDLEQAAFVCLPGGTEIPVP